MCIDTPCVAHGRWRMDAPASGIDLSAEHLQYRARLLTCDIARLALTSCRLLGGTKSVC